MKNFKIIATLAVVCVFILLACRKEEKPDINAAANPCECASEVSADFEIREALNNGAPSINMYTLTDDILGSKTAYFKAKIDDAEYTWYIGTDVETEREISRYFPEQWAGSNIPITLVVKKEPNTNCFPNDDGYDSITKIMRVHDQCDTNIMEGTFRVAEENSIDSFDIAFDFELAYAAPGLLSNSNCSRLDFYNYDGNGSNCVGYDNTMERNYRAFKRATFSNWGGSPTDCDNINVRKCVLDLDNSFYIEYSNGFSTETVIHNLFGRKLN